MHDADNADKIYDSVIMPFKGRLEEWYVSNRSLAMYVTLIIATIIVVFTGKIPFLESVFSSTPRVPKDLEYMFDTK